MAHRSPFVLHPNSSYSTPLCHTIVPCLLHSQVPLLIVHKCLRPETRGLPTHSQPIPQAAARPSSTREHCRPMPHTSCTAPRGFWPMYLLSWKGILTAFRLNEASFSCVPSSPSSLKNTALHPSISLFPLGIIIECRHTFINCRYLRAPCCAPYYNSVSLLFISDTAFLHYPRRARIRLRSPVSFPPLFSTCS